MKSKLLILSLLFCVLIDTHSQIPTDGLVGYWPFSENANDESGHGNNGTVYGATLTTSKDGNINSAYSFDGIDDYIEIPHNDIFNFCDSVFSISLWLKHGSQAGGSHDYSTIFIKSNDYNSPFKGITIFVDCPYEYNTNNGQVIFRLDKTEELLSESEKLNDNIWRHFVFVKTTDTIQIFINGEIDMQREVSNSDINNTAPIVLGANHEDKLKQNYEGLIDELRIYNRVLYQNEIEELYNEEITNINPPNNLDILKIYPNPSNDLVYINTGINFGKITDYKIRIISESGIAIFEDYIDQQNFNIDVRKFGQTGLFFVQIVDNANQIIDVRTLILE